MYYHSWSMRNNILSIFFFFWDWKGTTFRLTIKIDYIFPEEELYKLSWRNTRIFSWIFFINLIFDVTSLIRYYKACSQNSDFLDRDQLLTPRLLIHFYGFLLECSQKLYGHHHGPVSRYEILTWSLIFSLLCRIFHSSITYNSLTGLDYVNNMAGVL